MTAMIKKYLPYAIIIFAVFLLVPLIFISEPMQKFSAVGYYFILLMTQVVCSAVYCAKHGLDFLFTLIAPIAFLFTMMIYAGGFSNPTNIILLVVYLIAGIFGLFLGDLAFGDARRKQAFITRLAQRSRGAHCRQSSPRFRKARFVAEGY